VTVRRATRADGRAIAELQRRTWANTYRGLVPDEVLDDFDTVTTGRRWGEAAADRRPGRAVLVYERDGEAVGFASVAPVTDEAGVGELETLYVAPERQRAGIGNALHEAALAALTKGGAGEALLWVAEANVGARAFYEARGWAPDGSTGSWRGAATVRYRRAL
jgi:GNAT superfamily N-acetyltransferase